MTRMGTTKPAFLPRNLGVSLGFDFAAEHECGVGGIRQAFGAPVVPRWSGSHSMLSDFEVWKRAVLKHEQRPLAKVRDLLGEKLPPRPPMGLDKRRVYTVPGHFFWFTTPDGAQGFALLRGDTALRQERAWRRSQERVKDDLVGGWDEREFFILARSAASIAKLKDLYDAIQARNAVFCTPAKGLGGEGLCILVASRLPSEITDAWEEADFKAFENERRFDETGVEKVLADAGKSYFFLGQYHVHNDGIWRAWLNPYDQKSHNTGWYTVEELLLWAKDQGPVMQVRNSPKAGNHR